MTKVSVVQAEPVWFNLQGSVKKAITLIEAASKNGSELVAFPELFIPGYPIWIWQNAADIPKNINYIENSLYIDSDEFRSIQEAAAKYKIKVVLGFSERFGGLIYVSQAIIDSDGEILSTRRKIKATHVERVLFGDGKAVDLNSVASVEFKDKSYNVGCLNCWEHAQPLLTFNAATKLEDIHIGAWPPLDPYDSSNPSDLNSLRVEGCQALAQAYAIQNQCFYLFASAIITDEIYKQLDSVPFPFKANGGGCSAIYGPSGQKLTIDLDPAEEGLLTAEVNPILLTINRHFLDTIGHYSKPELFSLQVHQPNSTVVNDTL